MVSDDESQFSERIGQNEGRTDIGSEIVEAPAEVLNECVCGDDDPGGTVSLQPSHRSKSGLQASVVGLKRVVAWISVSWKAAGSNSSSARG
jgi:hypothetical protein